MDKKTRECISYLKIFIDEGYRCNNCLQRECLDDVDKNALTHLITIAEKYEEEQEFKIFDGMNKVLKDEGLYLNRAKRAEKKVKELQAKADKYDKVVERFSNINKMAENMKDIPKEYSEIINKRFWDLVG